MKDLFFPGWETLQHVFLSAVVSFIVIFLFIRIAGKRTMSKFNVFDFVVSVTLGSTLSWMIIAQITVSEGALASLVIILLQYLLAWLSKKSSSAEAFINAKPILLFYDGHFFKEAMEKEYLTVPEIEGEIRSKGFSDIQEVKAVIMESNGDITVIPISLGSEYSILKSLIHRNNQPTEVS